MLLKFFLSRGIILKLFGAIITIALALGCIYASLVTAAVMGEDLANTWAINYISGFSMDYFGT
jgi:hypothetical protein